ERSAYVEAIAHLNRGIDVVNWISDNSGKPKLELDLHIALGPCLISTQGPASAPAMTTFGRARELCNLLGDPPEYLQVLHWLATASFVRGELTKATEALIDSARL